MNDVLIPYRQTSSNELRYALRSIARHLPKSQVFISGDLPNWVTNVVHIPGDRAETAHQDVFNNISRAVLDKRMSNDFILMADDIYFTAPYKGVPSWNGGSLGRVAKSKLKTPSTAAQGRLLEQTDKLLKSMGHERPLSYALHIPMLMNKAKVLLVNDIVRPHIGNVSPRTVYGNLFSSTSSRHADVKVYDKTTPLPKPIASTWQSALGVAYNQLRAMYPEKCRYEI